MAVPLPFQDLTALESWRACTNQTPLQVTAVAPLSPTSPPMRGDSGSSLLQSMLSYHVTPLDALYIVSPKSSSKPDAVQPFVGLDKSPPSHPAIDGSRTDALVSPYHQTRTTAHCAGTKPGPTTLCSTRLPGRRRPRPSPCHDRCVRLQHPKGGMCSRLHQEACPPLDWDGYSSPFPSREAQVPPAGRPHQARYRHVTTTPHHR
ncbi:hypothetical protein GGR56DRAFT_450512 [Xylariaceae sp. FL0804]|nr:hypothetical protein GGR56DRAFT_450512 [Xylariaceae sp. FL0804]